MFLPPSPIRTHRPRGAGLRNYLIATFVLAGLVIAGLPGCQPEAIETYRAPRTKTPPAKVRLLGAILPHGDATWFIKLVGPLAGLETHEAAFNDFLHSIQFPDKAAEPITWKTPPGWEHCPAMLFAMPRFGSVPPRHLWR